VVRLRTDGRVIRGADQKAVRRVSWMHCDADRKPCVKKRVVMGNRWETQRRNRIMKYDTIMDEHLANYGLDT